LTVCESKRLNIVGSSRNSPHRSANVITIWRHKESSEGRYSKRVLCDSLECQPACQPTCLGYVYCVADLSSERLDDQWTRATDHV